MTNCPICNKEHLTNLFKCECGYERLKDYDQKDYLFEIYKFSKAIFNKKIPWNNSNYSIINENDKEQIIKEALENKYSVTNIQPNTNKYTKTDTGILPFNLNVKSLIINVDEIDEFLFDESNVRMLFIGERLKKIKGNNIKFYSPIRYLEVSSKNQFFSSDNNVLFDKEKKILLNYANDKQEEEYFILKSVKEISANAFYYVKNLKTIHVSKNVKIDKNAIVPKNSIEIKYDL